MAYRLKRSRRFWGKPKPDPVSPAGRALCSIDFRDQTLCPHRGLFTSRIPAVSTWLAGQPNGAVVGHPPILCSAYLCEKENLFSATPVLLSWRAGHRAVRAKDTAIAWPRV